MYTGDTAGGTADGLGQFEPDGGGVLLNATDASAPVFQRRHPEACTGLYWCGVRPSSKDGTVSSRRPHDVIITSLLCQNDVPMSYIIIAWRVRWIHSPKQNVILSKFYPKAAEEVLTICGAGSGENTIKMAFPLQCCPLGDMFIFLYGYLNTFQ